MSGWIKVDKDLIDDPRVLDAAHCLANKYIIAHTITGRGGSDLSEVELLRFACNAVTGALVTLWKYADEHIRDDDTLPITREALDALLGITDFFDLMPPEWVDELDDGTIILPRYCEKNALIAKKKTALKSNARVKAFRARNKGKGNAISNAHVTDVTTRYTPVTKMVDQDQDLDLKKETPLPPCIDLDMKAWDAWVSYRKAVGKAIKPASLELAQLDLAKYGLNQLAVVNQSIAAGWRGLFELKANGKAAPSSTATPAPPLSAEWSELLAAGRAEGLGEPYKLETPQAYAERLRGYRARQRPKLDTSQFLSKARIS